MKFDLSKAQRGILDSIVDWHKSLQKKYLTLGGYAGTGKTTLLGYLNTILHKEKEIGRAHV